jgi:hypothetical protein
MEEDELQQLVEEKPKQVSTPKLVEEKELQQHVSKDNGKDFLQELFEEELVYRVKAW